MSSLPNSQLNLLDLIESFKAGYPTAPPLRHARLAGFREPGRERARILNSSAWDLLLIGEGKSYKQYQFPHEGCGVDHEPWFQCCWVTDLPDNPALPGVLRHFRHLAALADSLYLCPGSSGLPERWVIRLHEWATHPCPPSLAARRFRFLQSMTDPDKAIRIDHPPQEIGGWPIFSHPEPDAFPHDELSILPDIFLASATALTLSPPCPPDESKNRINRPGKVAKRRGRPPQSPSQKDLDFSADWEQAKAAGVPFKEFCIDRSIAVKQGERILARLRMARIRSRT